MKPLPAYVEAKIAFVNDEWRDRAEMPRIYSRESRLANTTRHDVVVHNARPRSEAGELDLDRTGFVLVRHETSVTDFRNKDVVLREYFPQMRELMLQLTGAHDALPLGFFQVRSKAPAHFFDAYSLYMHCDFSPDTLAPFAQRVVAESGSANAYPASHWDFAFYNLWRPIGSVAEKDPLVVIDASTIARDDIINYSAIKEGKGHAAVPLYNKKQRYYYVPAMQTNEVLILKQLDSRPDRALVCPHTSFVDPTARSNAPDRQSIDIRFMCVYPKTSSG